jgi:CrcB protein
MNILWVFIGGGLGSLARYSISLLMGKWTLDAFPWATLISNILATGILGLTLYFFVSKWQDQSWIYPLIAVGFCGGFSTFSTFSNETLQLITSGNYLIAGLNVLISVVSGLAILYLLQRLN